MRIQAKGMSEISPEDRHELKRMLHMLTFASGFQLQAAQCDLLPSQNIYIDWLERQSDMHQKEMMRVDLSLKRVDSLKNELQAAVKARHPEGIPPHLAIMVTGLEWSIMLDYEEDPAVLQKLTAEREQSRRSLPHPIVLWLPRPALRKLARSDSTFSSWEGKVYEFTSPGEFDTDLPDDASLGSKFAEIQLLKRLRAQLPNLTDDTPEGIKQLHRDWAYRLGETYQAVGHHEQAIPLFMKVLNLDASDTWQHAARVHHAIGVSFWQTSQLDRAINSFDRALSLAQERGDKHLEYTALGNLGTIYNDLGSYETAVAYYEKALAVSREIGDRRGEAILRGNLGVSCDHQGKLEASIGHHQAALAISRQLSDASSESKHLGNLGGVHGKRGDWQSAIDHFEQALSVSRAAGDQRAEGAWLGNLGATYSRLGDEKTAVRYYQQALHLSREIEDKRSEGFWLGKLGLAHSQLGDHEIALACFTALQAIGMALRDSQIIEWAEARVERLKAEVGENAFERLKREVQARGAELTP